VIPFRLAGLAAVLALASCSHEPEKPEHVLLIVVDTLRADHLGVFGHERPTSPSIDRLARDGVLFEQAISQASWTSPSMVSLMTGRYIAKERTDLPKDLTTLAESFQEAGWATAGFCSNVVLSHENGFARGFERYEALPEYGGNEPIERWLGSVGGRKSFTYVHINEPHDPYLAPAAARPLLPPEEARKWREQADLLPGDRADFYAKVARELGLGDTAADIERIRREIGGYDDDVRYADARVAEFLALFERAGLREDGLVVLTADHGEGLWEHVALLNGQRGRALREGETPNLVNTLMPTHGNQVHHELVHVPLMIDGVGVPSGVKIAAPVENVDVYPTLLELCDVPGPAGLQGHSLLRWIEGEPPIDHAFSFTRFNVTVIRSDGMALILPTDEGMCSEGLEVQLYDLRSDPHQRVDLAKQRPEVVAALGKIAHDRTEQGIREGGVVSNATVAALQQLGYADKVEHENAKRRIEALETSAIVSEMLNMTVPCSLRRIAVEVLRHRELDEAAREKLREHARFETSRELRQWIEEMLAR
jgi:arylsulfatase A-like enzyme